MATRAEEAKAEMQRAAHAGKSKKHATHGAKARRRPTKAHNLAPKRNRKSSYQLDPVPVGKRPPRKSSRRGDNRQKPDGPLRITEMNKNSRPQARPAARRATRTERRRGARPGDYVDRVANKRTQRPRRFEPHAGGDRPDDGNAFLPDPGDGPALTSEDLAESMAEGFIEAATTGEEPDEQTLDAGYSEELGGPFVETSASEELAQGSDPANPADAESEPWPRPVAGLVVDPDIDDLLDQQASGDAGPEDDASDDPRSAAEATTPEPPDPVSDVDALNPSTPRGRTPL